LEIVERLCTHVGIIADGKLVEQAALDDIRQGGSLEARFIERVGRDESTRQNLTWLKENGA
jgi:ABC-2 type transport system ATP-binding protein